MGRKDITPKQQRFIDGYLKRLTYDLYDKLIIVCDALTDAQNFCTLEKRFVDTMRRVGAYPFTGQGGTGPMLFRKDWKRRSGAPSIPCCQGSNNVFLESRVVFFLTQSGKSCTIKEGAVRVCCGERRRSFHAL